MSRPLFCVVCGEHVQRGPNGLAWASHVNKHKRDLGDECYEIAKIHIEIALKNRERRRHGDLRPFLEGVA